MLQIELNVCGLEAPEPMERVLEALCTLERGARLAVLIEREPRPLYRILARNGYQHSISEQPGQLYRLLVWHAD
ncbi:MAG: DUF2249 domain-containing protein [Pseudomonadota bacterium]|nr:DUF2249 domain-containing protein [Pseudomonadota bacterium]